MGGAVGWALRDDVEFHCGGADVNGIMGMLVPPSEKGVVDNPHDTQLWLPNATAPGLVQGAARRVMTSSTHGVNYSTSLTPPVGSPLPLDRPASRPLRARRARS